MTTGYDLRMNLGAAVELVGEAIYRRAGCDSTHPPPAGAVDAAIGILGGGAIVLQPNALAEADIARIGGHRVIVIRRGTAPRRLHFLVGQQLARAWLDGESWYVGLEAARRTALSLAVGAWLVAPSPAFIAATLAAEGDITTLAARFKANETLVVMRLSETGGPDSAVTTPTNVYRRGRLFSGFGDAELRSLATGHRPMKTVRRVMLRDESGRVALLARAA